MSKEKEIKKITLGGIFSWVFGIIFALTALGSFSFSFFTGIIFLIMAAVLLPPVNKIFKEKLHFELSTGVKIAIIIIGFIIVSPSLSKMGNKDIKTIKNQNSSLNTPSTTEKKQLVQSYYLGDKVNVGSFAYTVNSYYTTDKLGQDLMGTFIGEKADGLFLIFNVTIENIGKESKTMWDSYIKVVDDQERTFEHDSTAEIYIPNGQQFLFEQMQPGLPKTGYIVFDVPKNLSGRLEISTDNILSSEKVYIQWIKRP